MKIKLYSFIIAGAILLCYMTSCQRIGEKPKKSETQKLNELKELYKESALLDYFKMAYPNDSLLQNDKSGAIYQDLSDFTIIFEVQESLDSAAKAALYPPKTKGSTYYTESETIFARGISFFQSKSLDSLVTVLAKSKLHVVLDE